MLCGNLEIVLKKVQFTLRGKVGRKCNRYGYWLVSTLVLILSLFYD